MTIKTSFLAMLFAVTLPVPHALIISWAIYNLLHKHSVREEKCCSVQDKSSKSVGREGARSTAEFVA